MVETQHVTSLVQRIQHQAAQHLRDFVQLVLDGRDDAEIAAATAKRLEQIGVIHGARFAELPIRCHDVRRDQVVDRKSVLAH
jgi:hypothetical protein